MSGVVGVWNLDGRPVERALLAAMSATLAHRGPDGEGVWVQGPVGFACRLFRTTPEAAGETQPWCTRQAPCSSSMAGSTTARSSWRPSRHPPE